MPFSMSYDVPKPDPVEATTASVAPYPPVKRRVPKLRDAPAASEAAVPPEDTTDVRSSQMDTPDDGAALLVQAEGEATTDRMTESHPSQPTPPDGGPGGRL